MKKPGQELYKSKLSEYFKAQDLYVGATVCLNSVNFQLLDADEYTFNYMEQHAEEVWRRNVYFLSLACCGFSDQEHEELIVLFVLLWLSSPKPTWATSSANCVPSRRRSRVRSGSF